MAKLKSAKLLFFDRVDPIFKDIPERDPETIPPDEGDIGNVGDLQAFREEPPAEPRR